MSCATSQLSATSGAHGFGTKPIVAGFNHAHHRKDTSLDERANNFSCENKVQNVRTIRSRPLAPRGEPCMLAVQRRPRVKQGRYRKYVSQIHSTHYHNTTKPSSNTFERTARDTNLRANGQPNLGGWTSAKYLAFRPAVHRSHACNEICSAPLSKTCKKPRFRTS